MTTLKLEENIFRIIINFSVTQKGNCSHASETFISLFFSISVCILQKRAETKHMRTQLLFSFPLYS